MPPSSAQQSGLVIWRHDLFDSQPIWSKDPDVSVVLSIARHHLRISETSPVSATFLSQGAFNKIYVIKSVHLNQSYIFRVTLPVDPFYKTASEVATLSYLRHHTSIPLAEVIAYDASMDNELGFEWILMDHLPGARLQDIWSNFLLEQDSDSEAEEAITSPKNRVVVPWDKKEEIVCMVAKNLLQLRKIFFKFIGSLYFASDIKDAKTVMLEDPRFVIGPLVSMHFFYGGIRSLVQPDRGPYNDERHYAEAFLNVALEELELAQRLEKGNPLYHEDLVEDGQKISEALKMLQTILPSIFSCCPDPSGYVLSHHDLSLSNILVDAETFKITGILDWECIGIIPRWEDALPQFLDTPDVDVPLEPPEAGDVDPFRIERWENWERMQLRRAFEKTIQHEKEAKRQYLLHLNNAIVWHNRAKLWAQEMQGS